MIKYMKQNFFNEAEYLTALNNNQITKESKLFLFFKPDCLVTKTYFECESNFDFLREIEKSDWFESEDFKSYSFLLKCVKSYTDADRIHKIARHFFNNKKEYTITITHIDNSKVLYCFKNDIIFTNDDLELIRILSDALKNYSQKLGIKHLQNKFND